MDMPKQSEGSGHENIVSFFNMLKFTKIEKSSFSVFNSVKVSVFNV